MANDRINIKIELDGVDAVGKEINKVDKDLVKLAGTTRKTEFNLKDLNQAKKAVNMSLKEMQNELRTLRQIPFDNLKPEQIDLIKRRMGELEDAVSKQRAEIQAYSMDTLPAFVSGLQAVTSAAQVTIGTMALFGVEDERMKKFSQTMVQLIGISQALSTVQQMYAAGQLQAIALKIKNAVVTTALAVKEGILAVVTGKLTAAQWGLNAAMAANPIGLVVAGIAALAAGGAYLISVWDDLSNAMRVFGLVLLAPIAPLILIIKYFDEIKQKAIEVADTLVFWKDIQGDMERATKAQDEFNESLKRAEDRTRELAWARQDYKRSLEAEIKLMQARGDSLDEIEEKQVRLMELEMRQLRARIRMEEIIAATFESLGNQRRAELRQMKLDLEDLELNLEIFHVNSERRRQDELTKIRRHNQQKEIEEQRRAADAGVREEAERNRQEILAGQELLAYQRLLVMKAEADRREDDNKKTREAELNARLLEITEKYKEDEATLLRAMDSEVAVLEYMNSSRRRVLIEEELEAKRKLRQEYEELENKRDEQVTEREKVLLLDLMNLRVLAEQTAEERLAARRKLMEAQKLAELERYTEDTELHHQMRLAITKKYEDEMLRAVREANRQKLNNYELFHRSASDLVNSLMQFEISAAGDSEEEQLKVRKKYALINAGMQLSGVAINTAEALMKVASQLGIYAPLVQGLIIAQGIVQSGIIIRETSNLRRMERGGMVFGPSHTSGGVDVELEGGEGVINKRSMANPVFRSLASAINVAGGGVPMGPDTDANVSVQIDKNSLREIVEEIVAIPVIVGEGDITAKQRRVRVIENRKRIG